MKLPTIKQLTELCRSIKETIAPEYRAFNEDKCPGIQLTVGWSEDGGWDYQTGDNSYSGGAYFYPHWAVVGVYKNSNCRDLARDIQNQLAELANWGKPFTA
jgi:hypothetical protein